MKKKLLSICVYVILVINIFSIGTVKADGNTIYVDDDNTYGPWDGTIEHPYQHIQDGIDAANNNDTVFILNGVYYETINITKSVNLFGENQENTIIDAKNNDYLHIITLQASYVKIENLTIVNGSMSYMACKGIYASNNLHLKSIYIANCSIMHNYMNILFWNVSDCSIINCFLSHTDENLGSLSIGLDSHNITIFNCTIENASSYGLWFLGEVGDYYNGQVSNISISYCDIHEVCDGIKFYNVKNATIYNNSIHNNSHNGILLEQPSVPCVTENITIWNNSIYGNRYRGIGCEGNDQVSNITIRNNNISNNSMDYGRGYMGNGEGGIVLYDSKIITIKNNIINSNFCFGIWLDSSENIQIVDNNILHSKSSQDANGIGIFFQRSSFNNITNNTIAYNQNHGIEISGINFPDTPSNYNTIYGNTIINNNRYGMIFHNNAIDNNIYHNNIINNTYGNAYDSCTNLWDNGYPSGGNFWDDYTGQDSNQDGIGDTSYTIDNGDQEDRYPLMTPVYHPTLNFPPIKPHKPDGPILIEKNVNYLYNSSTIDVNDDQVYYKWNWGDGSYSDWIGPVNSGLTNGTYHQWNQIGLYNIKVKAKDIHGAESNWSDTKPLVVELASVFSITPSEYGKQYQMIYFNDLSISYFNIESFQWNFGDNSISNIQNTSHTFINDGIYDVSLTVTDNKSNTNISHQLVYIDSVPPTIDSINNTPDICGFGFNITISANITDNLSGIKSVKVNITYPDYSHGNYTMLNTMENTYQYVFNSTWQTGQYNYTIWATDYSNNSNSSNGHHFHISATASISISTLQDSYRGNQYINITDPPYQNENYTLIGRGSTWDEYYNAITGQNIMEVSTEPINYQEDNGTWTPINNIISRLSDDHPAYVYGYRNGNNHGLYGAYFKTNAQNDWPMAFTYNRSEDPTIHVIRSKLVGVGYVDPQSSWAYQYLQNVQSSQGQTNDNSITYEGVFTGTDVTWSYGNNELKEEITLSNTTKAVLQNHPPSQYGLNNERSYLVFITKLNHQNLNLYNSSGLLVGNVTISDEGVEFKDVLGQSKCALPLGIAYELNNESIRQKLTYRIIQYNGNTYLLSGLKVSDLTAMTFPVVIDPTITINTSSSSDDRGNTNTNYPTAWSATTSNTITDPYIVIGQRKVSNNYMINRGFVFFNTSSLPTNAVIDNSVLRLYKYSDSSTTDFSITIQNGQPTYPHDPLQSSDYHKALYSGNGGRLNTASLVNGYNNITLNSTGQGWINLTGWTKLCMRSSRDINGTTPSGNEYVTFYSSSQGTATIPKLIITYRNQSKIKNAGSTDIKGYLLIQIHYYNTSQSNWVIDNDTINETTPRTINNSSQLALDLIFNGLVRASDLTYGSGTYRVYAAFRNPDGNILKTNDDTELEAWWQFSKT